MRPTEQILDTQVVRSGPPPAAPGMTVGGLLSTTLSIWWKHVASFTLLSVVVYSPFAVTFGLFYGTLLTAGMQPRGADDVASFGIAVFGVWLLTLFLAVIQAGAVTFGTVRHLAGERAGLGAMLRVGLRRTLPVIGVAIVLWLGFVLGFVLLVVPAVLLAVASCVAIPAAVVERPGVTGAIRRSFALTRGRRGTLFAAGLVILMVVWVLAAIVQVGVTAVSALLLPREMAMAGMMIASQLGNVFFSALPLVGIAVAYHELRQEKEGVDTAALAKVFE